MEKMDFIHKCPLSQNEDKLCMFAEPAQDTIFCKAVITWWHDLDIALHDRCFDTLKNRDKLLWRNRQLHNWKKGPGTKPKDKNFAKQQRQNFKRKI